MDSQITNFDDKYSNYHALYVMIYGFLLLYIVILYVLMGQLCCCQSKKKVSTKKKNSNSNKKLRNKPFTSKVGARQEAKDQGTQQKFDTDIYMTTMGTRQSRDEALLKESPEAARRRMINDAALMKAVLSPPQSPITAHTSATNESFPPQQLLDPSHSDSYGLTPKSLPASGSFDYERQS